MLDIGAGRREVAVSIATTNGMETPGQLLNKSRLNLRDYTLLTDISKVLSDCPAALSFPEVLSKFERLNLEVSPLALESLFLSVDSQREGKVPARLFAKQYSYTVQQLSEDAFSLREKAEATQQLILALKDQIADPVTNEAVNSWGISENSALRVTIGRVTGVNPPKPCSLVVICERQRQVTRTLMSNFVDGWGEEIEFRVATGAGDVLISLLVENEIVGQCAVPIPTLRDQRRHEAWVDMVTSSKPSHIKLNLSLQWLHNLRQHLRDQIDDHVLSISQTLQAVRDTEARLKELGMRWDEDWTDAVLRKVQVAIECMKQSSCTSQCSTM